ncbi:MAG: protein kinase, partial [Gemmataceae bacterium]|nr:protein kinase [Gemmataceae bacterium]
MAIACAAGLVDELGRACVLEPEQLRHLRGDLAARGLEPRELARELLRRGWLTAFQANQLFLGRGADLVLGQYVLLERLGAGGMGQVFKARHRRLDRVVALKVMRREYLDNPNALARFRREIQVAAQLDHPHVVRALDADVDGDRCYFAMEYVEGIDLARLVKERGPLPVAQACDHVRQAALGLGHAHERGLVHRDIKPGNLIVQRVGAGVRGSSAILPRPHTAAGRWGVVKILDLGLVRLLADDADGQSTQLTQLGAIMGTPDYIAPEQARNSRACDIRADLYSLGCTFYYLLAGQVPFPSGTITEKLLYHQLDEPEALNEVRRRRLLEVPPGRHGTDRTPADLEVPAEVRALVARLTAKRPEDRLQTPADLAGALAEVARRWEPGGGTVRQQRVAESPRLRRAKRGQATRAAQRPVLALPTTPLAEPPPRPQAASTRRVVRPALPR